MRIYLVQHGKSKSEEEDPEKPLTEEGRKESEAMAKSLKGRVKISKIYCSKKLRAKQTAEIFSKALGVKPEPVDGLAPNDRIDEATVLLADGVIIVGHLPHLSKLASKLLVHDETRDIVKFSNSGVLCLEKEEIWHLVFYMVP
jgi:phosphohistidine phosphatase